jgi:hypothetical protein
VQHDHHAVRTHRATVPPRCSNSPCNITTTLSELTPPLPCTSSPCAISPSLQQDGWSALHWAAKNGYDTILQALLRSSADVNICNKNGNTALHKASRFGHLGAVSLLAKAGANLDLQEKVGHLPTIAITASNLTPITLPNLTVTTCNFAMHLTGRVDCAAPRCVRQSRPHPHSVQPHHHSVRPHIH